MIAAVILLATSAFANSGGSNEENSELPVFEKSNLPATFSSSGFLQRREVPEALIDPYSVLGVLSFGVYIFYILYHRYQMGLSSLKHDMGSPGGQPTQPGAPPAENALFHVGSEQNIAYILDAASKILSTAANGNSFNGTSPLLDTLDYYDDSTDTYSSD